MEKFVRFLPIVLFCAYFGKIVIKGNDSADAGLLAILAITSIAFEIKPSLKRMTAMEDKFTSFNNVIVDQQKQIEDLKTHVSSLKLSAARFQNVR